MKIKSFLLFVLSSLIVGVYGQEGESAKVYFDLTYKGISAEDQEDLPKKVSYLVSGNNTMQVIRTTQSTEYIISNGDSLFLANLTDIEADRVGIIYYADDIEKSLSSFTIDIKSSLRRKTILGYSCKKYVITIFNKHTNVKIEDEVYATEAIGGENVNFLLYKGLKGFILSSEKTNGKEVTTMLATRVVKQGIPASKFLIPDEYTVTTYKDQLKLDE